MKKTLLFVIFVLSVLIFVTGCKKKEQYLDQGGWVDLSDEDIATITRNYNGSWHTTTMINGSMKDAFLDMDFMTGTPMWPELERNESIRLDYTFG